MLSSKIKRILVVLFLISIFIINADEGAAEGEDLAKGDEYTVMDLAQRRANEARYEQYTAKCAQTCS